jgi:hypothetical protein
MVTSAGGAGAYWSLLRRVALVFAEGLISYGASTAGVDPRAALAALKPIDRQPPPAGHPERCAADVPPTAVEREIWSRLF